VRPVHRSSQIKRETTKSTLSDCWREPLQYEKMCIGVSYINPTTTTHPPTLSLHTITQTRIRQHNIHSNAIFPNPQNAPILIYLPNLLLPHHHTTFDYSPVCRQELAHLSTVSIQKKACQLMRWHWAIQQGCCSRSECENWCENATSYVYATISWIFWSRPVRSAKGSASNLLGIVAKKDPHSTWGHDVYSLSRQEVGSAQDALHIC